jgi:hypothetical protein
LRAPVVLDEPDPRVEGQVLRHLLVGVEVDGVEPGTPRLGFGELQEGPSKPDPAMAGMHRDVVDQEPFTSDAEDDDPHDGAVVFGDGDLTVADDLGAVVGHRAGQHPDALDVVPVCGVDEFSHARSIRRLRRPE